METLAKAREWLARTETRLMEINNETQQKIKLFGTLSKRDRGLRKSPGSPDLSTREVVVKLAREGWKSDEIARQTKLSQGEVELILELTPKS
jgi:DNA-binding NarL/FixJ family response regulator